MSDITEIKSVRTKLIWLAQIVCLSAVYFLTGKLGLETASVSGYATLVWMPSGLSLAAVLLWGNRIWPGIFLGAFLVNLSVGGSPTIGLAMATGNTFEAVIGAALLNHFHFRNSLNRAKDVLLLIFFGATLSTVVSATIGVSYLYLEGQIDIHQYAITWLTWWIGDLMGDLIIAPVLLTWSSRAYWQKLSFSKLKWNRIFEAIGFFLAIVCLSGFLFFGFFSNVLASLRHLYLIFPLLLWSALRFGQRVTALTNFLFAAFGIIGTVTMRYYFFSTSAFSTELFELQAFLGVSFACTLLITAVEVEKRREKRNLNKNRAHLSAIFESSMDSIISFLQDGRIIHFNSASEKNFGYRADEAIGKSINDLLIVSSKRNEFEEVLRRIEFGSPHYRLETELRRSDGSTFPAEFSLARLRVRRPAIYTGYIRDITIKKREEQDLLRAQEILENEVTRRTEQLRASEERARLIIAGVKDYAIFMLDPEGHIISWNEGAQRINGYEAREVIGKHFSVFYPPEDVESKKPQRELQLALEYGRFEDIGWRVRKDGKYYWSNVIITPIHDSLGEVRGFSKVTRDITERKNAEEALHKAHGELEHRVQQRTAELARVNQTLRLEIQDRIKAERELELKAAELERSNAELEQFAFVASHDLKEPLRTISIYVDMLQHRYAHLFDEKANNYLRHLIDASVRMQNLIEALLRYGQVGRSQPQLGVVEANALVHRVLEFLKPKIDSLHAKITIEALPSISVDPVLMSQIFQNLISNAIKYHRPEEDPVVEVGCIPKTKEWVFFVRDNGIGFDMKYSQQIFQLFKRLHGNSEYTGTGIGLAVCKKIIEKHGGRIWAESEVGKGSTFYFSVAKTLIEVKPGSTQERITV